MLRNHHPGEERNRNRPGAGVASKKGRKQNEMKCYIIGCYTTRVELARTTDIHFAKGVIAGVEAILAINGVQAYIPYAIYTYEEWQRGAQ